MNTTPRFASLVSAGRPRRLDAEQFVDTDLLPSGACLEVFRRPEGARYRISGSVDRSGTAHQLVIVDNHTGTYWWGWAGASATHRATHPDANTGELGELPLAPVDTTAATWLYEYGQAHGIPEFTTAHLPAEHNVAVSVAAACAALEEFVYLEFPATPDGRYSIGWLFEVEGAQLPSAGSRPQDDDRHAAVLHPTPAPPQITLQHTIDDAAFLHAEFQLALDELLRGTTGIAPDFAAGAVRAAFPDRPELSLRAEVLGVLDLAAGAFTWNWALDTPLGATVLSERVRDFGRAQRIAEFAGRSVPTATVSPEALTAATKPVTGQWTVLPVQMDSRTVVYTAVSHPDLRMAAADIDQLDRVFTRAFAAARVPVVDQRRALETWASLHEGVDGRWIDPQREMFAVEFRTAAPATVFLDAEGYIRRVSEARDPADAAVA